MPYRPLTYQTFLVEEYNKGISSCQIKIPITTPQEQYTVTKPLNTIKLNVKLTHNKYSVFFTSIRPLSLIVHYKISCYQAGVEDK